MNYDDELRMRPTRLNGDVASPNDYVVIWRDITVGRILKQPGTPVGKPNWFWGVNLPGQLQPAAHRGICSDIEECKRRFKVVWSGVRAGLSDDAVDDARRAEERAGERRKWPGADRGDD
jgi:hypothetical protein